MTSEEKTCSQILEKLHKEAGMMDILTKGGRHNEIQI